MESNTNQATGITIEQTSKTNWNRVLGFVLLTPPLASVLIFFLQIFIESRDLDILDNFTYSNWRGYGDSTSTLPIYFGLMAIAGAMLLSNSNKK